MSTARLIAQEGDLSFPFEEGKEEWIIGRDSKQADFLLEDSTVSRKHVSIKKTPDGYFIHNLSRTNATLVNDTPLHGRVLLREGDRVTIGRTVFLFSESGGETTHKTPKEKKEGYDALFADLEEPAELPPEPTPVEEPAPTTEEITSADLSPETPKTAYDTIFEDTGQEELPLSLLPETPLVLKVIGGPNAGAEIGLEKGRSYTIGKDPNSCDIVFQDLSVSRQQAKLSISLDGIIELEDLGSKNGTMVNGVAVQEKRTVTSQDLIATGTTLFLIIDREAIEDTIYAPLSPAFEMPRSFKEEILTSTEELAEQPKTTDWKSEKIPTKHLVLAGALVLISLITFLSFFSLFKSETIEIVQKQPHETIKEALEKFPGVQYTFNPAGGKLFLAGHVLTPVDYQEMNFNLKEIPSILNIEDNVVIDEGVTKMMNDVLSGNAGFRSVTVGVESPGKFVARGVVQNNDDAIALSEYLMVNFPYLDRLENKVVVADVLNMQIQNMLHSGGYGAVVPQFINGELILSGRYSEKQSSKYKDVVKKLHKLDGVQSVKDFSIATLPGAAAIDLTKQYTVTGSAKQDGHGYSAVINGRMYTVGQTVDGLMITTIEPNSILLEKDGLDYKIDYTL
jgi:type III secretion system YscD/HrpQ family protein